MGGPSWAQCLTIKTSSSSSSSSSSVTNYVAYEGDYNAFLIDELGLKAGATKQDIKDAIGAKAEAAVKDIILVYVLKNFVESTYGVSVGVTDEDIESFKSTWQYWLLTYQVGEENVDDNDYIHAIQLDNVLDYLLEVKEKAEDDESNVIEYVRIKYSFKSETETE